MLTIIERVTTMKRYGMSEYFHIEKWYSIKKSDWMKFIDLLYQFGRKDPKKEAQNITDKYEQDCWTAYYMAKERGKNQNGLFELPWDWRVFVLNEIKKM